MTDTPIKLRPADLDDARIRAMLATHAERALSNARCRVGHALDLDALRGRQIEVLSLWRGGEPIAVGALRALDVSHGELKSMFVADAARGQGIGGRLLDHLVDAARRRGMKRLSLETGTSSYFDAARRLYMKRGFERCEAFADLPPHPDSVFLTRKIRGSNER